MKTFIPWLSLISILEIALNGFGDGGLLVMEHGDGNFGHHQKIFTPYNLTQQLYKLPLNSVWVEISLRGFKGCSRKALQLARRGL
jgi:hypothetical protein